VCDVLMLLIDALTPPIPVDVGEVISPLLVEAIVFLVAIEFPGVYLLGDTREKRDCFMVWMPRIPAPADMKESLLGCKLLPV